ncbi:MULTISPECIES: enoyl-CoA hydratase/isomerase family protein [Pseudomonas]|jgi:2-(1,2-epoxy-1,2-dihydrophenyl)acetyl-CoA isomerase|uniref:enoyl-CoA hydratase/isomerase family protein n=1 Tax=Pseudomonas TaxID=286 RepID=UPI0009BF4BDE|nr:MULTISPECIES: enoyl-CoA hydratase/isomerase family protein [Pseudomonas]MDT3709972.1 enoyl-CoA hydratase/isomerase family protein [Pseudomonadaceae bacterium]UIP87674.1 enoyl-CoA hydratase/isomerase family protein [Pseudomonas phenolilytica]
MKDNAVPDASEEPHYAGKTLTLSIANGIAWMTFIQADTLNALSPAMAQEFLQACQSLSERDELKALVLQGSGKAFMAGGDLHALRQDPEAAVAAIIPPMNQAVLLLQAMPIVIIARLQGAVAGAGLSLACLADISIAAQDTRFVYAYSNIATTCDLGLSWHLVRRLGLSRSIEIALLSRGLDARQAAEWGLVNQVVDRTRLDQAVQTAVERLATMPIHVVRATKSLLLRARSAPLEVQLELEHRMFLECAQRAEFVVAVDEFFAKRR